MTRKVIQYSGLCLVWVIFSSAAFGQTEKVRPFIGVVTEESVNVRAGAGKNYYRVSYAKQGDVVEVRDSLWGWYHVKPLPGSFSFVAKEYVTLGADGKKGTIKGNRVRVRAPSPAGPDKSYRTQVMLKDGDEVSVLGAQGDYYKIEPPDGVDLFIFKEYVRKATAEEIAAWKKANAPVVKKPVKPDPPVVKKPVKPDPPVVKKPVKPDPPVVKKPVKPDPPVVKKPVKPVLDKTPTAKPDVVNVLFDGAIDLKGRIFRDQAILSQFRDLVANNPATAITVSAARNVDFSHIRTVIRTAQRAGIKTIRFSSGGNTISTTDGTKDNRPKVKIDATDLKGLEKQFFAATKLDAADQPLGELKLAYNKLLTAENISKEDQALIKARLDWIKTQQEVRERLADIRKFENQTIDQTRARKVSQVLKPKEYIVVGRLVASSLYTGERLPLLYRVVNPLTRRTAAYIRPREGDNIAKLLGQYVGVVGKRQYDSGLKLNVVTVDDIDALTPAGRP